MGVVRVHDIGPLVAEDAGQHPGRTRVQIAAESHGAHPEAGHPRPRLEATTRPAGDGHGVAAGGHPQGGRKTWFWLPRHS